MRKAVVVVRSFGVPKRWVRRLAAGQLGTPRDFGMEFGGCVLYSFRRGFYDK